MFFIRPLKEYFVIFRLPHRNVGIENIQKDSLPDANIMVDWHNWTLIHLEQERLNVHSHITHAFHWSLDTRVR